MADDPEPPAIALYDVVRVKSGPHEEIVGREGTVLGVSADDATSFAVFIEDEVVWMVDKGDLEATGRKRRQEDIYDGTVAHVSPTGEILGITPPGDA